MTEPPSYHDLYVTTEQIPRTRLFDLPYGLEVNCSRVTGWTLWDMNPPPSEIAGEYDTNWLVLDVAGHVIVDSRYTDADLGVGQECPHCGDTYHDLPEHLELNYKGCGDMAAGRTPER